MIARMIPADSRPMPTGGPENSAPRQGTPLEQRLQRLLDEARQDRAEHEQAPHAVDDRGHRREQLDRGAERALEPDRRQLGQEQRDAEAHRHGDDQRDQRGHQRAVDHHQAAVTCPAPGPTRCVQRKPRPNSRIAGAAPMTQRDEDAGEQRRASARRRRARAPRTARRPRARRAAATADGRRAGSCRAVARSRRRLGGKCSGHGSAESSPARRDARRHVASLEGDRLARRVLDARCPGLAHQRPSPLSGSGT